MDKFVELYKREGRIARMGFLNHYFSGSFNSRWSGRESFMMVGRRQIRMIVRLMMLALTVRVPAASRSELSAEQAGGRGHNRRERAHSCEARRASGLAAERTIGSAGQNSEEHRPLKKQPAHGSFQT